MGVITKPKTWVDNEVVNFSDLNSDFDTLYTLVNGNIDNDNIKASAGIVFSKLDSATVAGVSATQTLTNKTLTTPKIGTSLNDTNGNEIIKTPATASAVNEVTVTNAATGNSPEIAATGDDTNIHLALKGKGNGLVKLPVLRQDDITNTYKTNQVVLTGWGYKQGDGSVAINETVTFGVTFADKPIVLMSMLGGKATASGAPSDIGDFTAFSLPNAKSGDITTTNFKAQLYKSDNFENTYYWGYSWIAIGTLS